MRYILKDVRQWKIRYDLLRFGILTLVVVLFWAGIELFNTYSSTTIPEDYSEEIKPLNPTLDLEMISEIESRVDAPEEFEVLVGEDVDVSTQIIKTSSSSASISTTTPTSSGSGQL